MNNVDATGLVEVNHLMAQLPEELVLKGANMKGGALL